MFFSSLNDLMRSDSSARRRYGGLDLVVAFAIGSCLTISRSMSSGEIYRSLEPPEAQISAAARNPGLFAPLGRGHIEILGSIETR